MKKIYWLIPLCLVLMAANVCLFWKLMQKERHLEQAHLATTYTNAVQYYAADKVRWHPVASVSFDSVMTAIDACRKALGETSKMTPWQYYSATVDASQDVKILRTRIKRLDASCRNFLTHIQDSVEIFNKILDSTRIVLGHVEHCASRSNRPQKITVLVKFRGGHRSLTISWSNKGGTLTWGDDKDVLDRYLKYLEGRINELDNARIKMLLDKIARLFPDDRTIKMYGSQYDARQITIASWESSFQELELLMAHLSQSIQYLESMSAWSRRTS